MVINGELDGWVLDVGNFINLLSDNDWFYIIFFVIGNGIWGLFIGINCCIDIMFVFGEFILIGILFIFDGIGFGNVLFLMVSVLGFVVLLGLGLVGLLVCCKFMK